MLPYTGYKERAGLKKGLFVQFSNMQPLLLSAAVEK